MLTFQHICHLIPYHIKSPNFTPKKPFLLQVIFFSVSSSKHNLKAYSNLYSFLSMISLCTLRFQNLLFTRSKCWLTPVTMDFDQPLDLFLDIPVSLLIIKKLSHIEANFSITEKKRFCAALFIWNRYQGSNDARNCHIWDIFVQYLCLLPVSDRHTVNLIKLAQCFCWYHLDQLQDPWKTMLLLRVKNAIKAKEEEEDDLTWATLILELISVCSC